MTIESDRARPAKELDLEEDRRQFLATCGKFAAVTPPVLTLLLSTSLNTEAIARSGGGWGKGGGQGGGDHDHDHDGDDHGGRHQW